MKEKFNYTNLLTSPTLERILSMFFKEHPNETLSDE